MTSIKIILLLCYFTFPGFQNSKIESQKIIKLPQNVEQVLEKDKLYDQEIYSDPCVILIEPSEQKIDSLKKSNSEQDYAALVDDNVYYMSKSRDYLQSKNVKIIDRKAIGKVRFKKADGTIIGMDISKFYWGIILFNGHSNPIEANMTGIEADYNRFMK
jgi:hypothetical protein